MEQPHTALTLALQILAAGGGGAVIAFLIFRFLGKSWIANRFARNLEQFRHEQAMELQRLRVEIDSTLSGTLKLQEKEFEVLPDAWRRLHDAYQHVSSLVSPGQSYPNLDKMTSEQIEEFLGGSDLQESQKETIRNADLKVAAYAEEIYWHKLHNVKTKCRDFYKYVIRAGMFLTPDLKSDFENIAEKLWDADSSKEIRKEVGDYKLQREGWEPEYESIQRRIHDRLRTHGKSH